MSNALTRYRELDALLDRIREEHQGEDSFEEREFMCEMDAVWYSLSKTERDIINAEFPPLTPQTLPQIE